ELAEARAPVPALAHDGVAVHLAPRRRAGERPVEARGVRLPYAEVEVEVVLAVGRRAGRRGRRRRGREGEGENEKRGSAKRFRHEAHPDDRAPARPYAGSPVLCKT